MKTFTAQYIQTEKGEKHKHNECTTNDQDVYALDTRSMAVEEMFKV